MPKEDIAAELYMMGGWKMRRMLIRRHFRHLKRKELAEALLIACFVDLCKLFFGKDWVREKINGVKR